jgi:GNAT superfamily N-acetyltransferase
MQFELTEALINNILFSMEDQEGEFLVNVQSGIVIGGSDELKARVKEKDGPYLSLPKWDSSDGFRLMERFTAGLRNPLLREELSAALDRGKGVFRAFKDILGCHPETEKLWYTYKDREMKREILRWYNALREEWGLEKIGAEPEETGDLVLEDFRFRPPQAGDAKTLPADYSLIAETVGGEFAGYITAVPREKALHIAALEVKPEYRGLGIGEALVTGFLERFDPKKISQISIDLPAEMEGFARVLLRNSFHVFSIRYCTNPEDMRY